MTDIPKYSLTIQNPESVTCEKQIAPEPTAKATSAGSRPGYCGNTGNTIPVAVIIATVAEPTEKRIIAATNQAKISGLKERLANTVPSCVPRPLSNNTLLKAPPAPITSKIPATGPKHCSVNFSNWLRLKPRAIPKDQYAKRQILKVQLLGYQ